MSQPAQPEHKTVAEYRLLAQKVLNGGRAAATNFGDLISRLINLTIAKDSGHVPVISGSGRLVNIQGWNDAGNAVPLTNGCFLRIAYQVYLSDKDDYLRTAKNIYQYQTDQPGKNTWIFRYDYIRKPDDIHPPSHLQIRANLTESVPVKKNSLEHVHFPTERVSIEAILRLLINDFDVPCKCKEVLEDETPLWEAVLRATEAPWQDVAHRSTNPSDKRSDPPIPKR
ncbi:MAG: hypothetical protein K8F91_18945 [Candidatus Obscuribacterales bacterium]|nr:hypothetical protein [Candidatus Obscuribacterales bacterium]